ncbi:Kinesin light chain 2 [Streptomyces paludis]|uniref:Kinesin light chain 2 n=1 Tax=Streptomyces paludis TaxID=2282738 RepID=A0A345I2G4_9ACTN|nr:Kinesin light chain 2 [Streptomyces paludis]
MWTQAKDSPAPAPVPAPAVTAPAEPRYPHHAAARVPVSFPHQIGVLPLRAARFQDRLVLRQALEDSTVAVLGGMGGVGKTQLAADHARHIWQHGRLDLLLWVTAATRQAVIDAYAQAGTDLLNADPAHPEQAAAAFLAWLEPKPGPAPRRWLIVLDDVAEAADLHGLWPPASTHGRTLVTTRRRDAALNAHGLPVQVDLFTTAEATTYLTAAGRHEPDDQLAALAEDLGHLPLALSQAAAYLTDTALDCTTYRTRLADRARRLHDLLPEPGSLPDQQPATVAAAWSLSLEHANQLRPAGLARPMLHLTAMLDPNGIPDTVLTSTPALNHLTEHRTTSAAAPEHGPDRTTPVTTEQAYQALRALHRLNLIDHTPATPHQAVRVHQLIQRAVLDPLTPHDTATLARTAADTLTAAWPEIERDTAMAQALRANTDALTHHAPDALWQPDAHAVLFRTGRSIGENGQVTAAINHFQHLAHTADQRLGPDHPDTLTARGNLASLRGVAGDAAGAAAAFQELLADCVRVLGADHPDTLTARNNLAHWRRQGGHPGDP